MKCTAKSRFCAFAIVLSIVSVTALAQPQPKNCLMEMVVGTDCGACKLTYPIVEDLKAAYPPPQLTVIRYYSSEGGDLYSTSEIDARIAYYVWGQGIPWTFHNGLHGFGGAGTYDWYESFTLDELAKVTPFDLEATAQISGNGALVTVAVKLLEDYSGTAPVLRVALVEDDVAIHENLPYTDIARRIVDVGIVTIGTENQRQEFTQYFNISQGWREQNLRALAFVQNDDTREILQVAGAERVVRPEQPYGKFSGHLTIMIPTSEGDQEVVIAPLLNFAWTRPWWWIEDRYQPWAVELLAGYNPVRFNPWRLDSSAHRSGNSYMLNVNLNLKYYFGAPGSVNPFVGAGPGYYLSEVDEFGLGGTCGLRVPLTDKTDIEIGANFHAVFDDRDTRFLQVGVGLLRDLQPVRGEHGSR